MAQDTAAAAAAHALLERAEPLHWLLCMKRIPEPLAETLCGRLSTVARMFARNHYNSADLCSATEAALERVRVTNIYRQFFNGADPPPTMTYHTMLAHTFTAAELVDALATMRDTGANIAPFATPAEFLALPEVPDYDAQMCNAYTRQYQANRCRDLYPRDDEREWEARERERNWVPRPETRPIVINVPAMVVQLGIVPAVTPPAAAVVAPLKVPAAVAPVVVPPAAVPPKATAVVAPAATRPLYRIRIGELENICLQKTLRSAFRVFVQNISVLKAHLGEIESSPVTGMKLIVYIYNKHGTAGIKTMDWPVYELVFDEQLFLDDVLAILDDASKGVPQRIQDVLSKEPTQSPQLVKKSFAFGEVAHVGKIANLALTDSPQFDTQILQFFKTYIIALKGEPFANAQTPEMTAAEKGITDIITKAAFQKKSAASLNAEPTAADLSFISQQVVVLNDPNLSSEDAVKNVMVVIELGVKQNTFSPGFKDAATNLVSAVTSARVAAYSSTSIPDIYTNLRPILRNILNSFVANKNFIFSTPLPSLANVAPIVSPPALSPTPAGPGTASKDQVIMDRIMEAFDALANFSRPTTAVNMKQFRTELLNRIESLQKQANEKPSSPMIKFQYKTFFPSPKRHAVLFMMVIIRLWMKLRNNQVTATQHIGYWAKFLAEDNECVKYLENDSIPLELDAPLKTLCESIYGATYTESLNKALSLIPPLFQRHGGRVLAANVKQHLADLLNATIGIYPRATIFKYDHTSYMKKCKEELKQLVPELNLKDGDWTGLIDLIGSTITPAKNNQLQCLLLLYIWMGLAIQDGLYFGALNDYPTTQVEKLQSKEPSKLFDYFIKIIQFNYVKKTPSTVVPLYVNVAKAYTGVTFKDTAFTSIQAPLSQVSAILENVEHDTRYSSPGTPAVPWPHFHYDRIGADLLGPIADRYNEHAAHIEASPRLAEALSPLTHNGGQMQFDAADVPGQIRYLHWLSVAADVLHSVDRGEEVDSFLRERCFAERPVQFMGEK